MHDIRTGEKRHQDCDTLHIVLEIAEMDGVILIFHHKLFNIFISNHNILYLMVVVSTMRTQSYGVNKSSVAIFFGMNQLNLPQ